MPLSAFSGGCISSYVMLKLCKVKGHSMSPSYLEGDYVLCVTSKLIYPKPGDCIVFKNERHGHLIKQITAKTDHGFFVEGTHPESTDSHSIGLIPPEKVVGKVIMKISQTKTKQI